MSTIIIMTWQEMWRKKALMVTILMSVAAIGLFLLFVHTQGAGNYGGELLGRYMAGMASVIAGLYLFNFIVAYLAIFSAAGTISAEVESGLLLAILPRPISRWQIYVGKWIGYAAWCIVYAGVMFAAIFLIVRVQLQFPWHWRDILLSLGLFELIPLILVTVTAFGSLYLSTLGNGIAVTLLYSIGMIGGFLGRIGSLSNHAHSYQGIVFWTSLIMPADAAYHRMTYEIMGGNSASPAMLVQNFLGPFGASSDVPSGSSILYIGMYVLIFLILGILQFGRRDI